MSAAFRLQGLEFRCTLIYFAPVAIEVYLRIGGYIGYISV